MPPSPWLVKLRDDWQPFPALAEALEAVLQRGADFRATLEVTKAKQRLKKVALEAEAQSSLEKERAAIDAIVGKHARASDENDDGATQRQLEYAALVISYRRKVEQIRNDVEAASAGVNESEDVKAAVDAFNAAVEKVETVLEETKAAKDAATAIAPMPWQVRYCAESDPTGANNKGGSDSQTVTFYGGKITDRFGRDIWEDRCSVLGVTIQAGAFGHGVTRFKSTSTKGATRCEQAHAWQSVMRNTSVEEAANDVFYEVSAHPVMAHLDLVDFATSAASREGLLGRAVHAAFKLFAHNPFLLRPSGDSGADPAFGTYDEVYTKVLHVAKLLRDLHEKNGPGASNGVPFVGISLSNSPLWLIVDLACAINGWTSVGMHKDWPVNEARYVLRHAGISVLVASEEQRKQLQADSGSDEDAGIHAGLQIITPEEIHTYLEKVASCPPGELPRSPLGFGYDTEVLKTSSDAAEGDGGRVEVKEEVPATNHEDASQDAPLFALMYSSGTSGALKAIEVTQKSWFEGNAKHPRYDLQPYVVMSYAALAHGMDRGMCWGALFIGGRVWFASMKEAPSEVRETQLTALDAAIAEAVAPLEVQSAQSSAPVAMPPIVLDIRCAGPSLFVASPDLWGSIYDSLLSRGIPQAITALVDKDGEDAVNEVLVALRLAMFGKRLGHAATGGAPISPGMFAFLKLLFAATLHPAEDMDEDETSEETKAMLRARDVDGIWFYSPSGEHKVLFSNVYGATEAPGISTDGVIRSGLELKLLDVPVLGYVAAEGVGEIAVRGSGVAERYFLNSTATEEVFKDGGWYHTADVGRLTPADTSKGWPEDVPRHIGGPHSRLEIIDRANAMLEMYVDHRSAWVPASAADSLVIGDHSSCGGGPPQVHVHSCVVASDRMQDFLVAVVVIDCARSPFFDRKGSFGDLERNELIDLLRASMAARARTLNLPDFAVPRGFVVDLVPDVADAVSHNPDGSTMESSHADAKFADRRVLPWSSAAGLISPLGKVKRRAVLEIYADAVAAEFIRAAAAA